MIAAWMVYCVAVGLAFVVAAHALERGLRLAGRPTRWAWVLALAGCCVVPAAAWLRPQAFASVSLPPAVPASAPVVPSGSAEPIPRTPAPSRWTFAWRDLDRALEWGWRVASVAVVVLLSVAMVRLSVWRRRWRAAVVDGRAVLISERVGPAVAGLWPPRVIIPRWALALPAQQRRLMLDHEEEHVRARDPWLLAVSTALLAVAPWNLPVWWLVQRLRLAIEIDCDARVLARGHRAPEYGELLLQVGSRADGLPLGAAALGEPRSFLEHRIRRIVARVPRGRWPAAAAALAVAAGAVVAACEAPRPVEPAPTNRDIAALTLQRMERVDSMMAEARRPWIRENLERYYPDLLRETSGPPVDVLLGHDASLRVSHVARLAGDGQRIGSDRIRGTFPLFRSGNDAWGVVDRRALRGLVRDNVRVVWVHLSAANGRTPADTEVRVDEVLADIGASGRFASVLVRHEFPQLLRGREEPVYLWVVFDGAGRLVSKGTAPRVLGSRLISTEMGARLIPGYDTLLARQAREYGAIGYGVLAPNSPPVLWVRLGPREH